MAYKVDRVVSIRDGRTSSEFIRRKTYAEELEELGNGLFGEKSDDTHEELAVIDRAGRLQIPPEYLAAMGLKGSNKVKVELDGDKVILRKPGDIIKN
jgi:hypothetical protein